MKASRLPPMVKMPALPKLLPKMPMLPFMGMASKMQGPQGALRRGK
jgi:hypothetical protein